jgi:hypothetical protein
MKRAGRKTAMTEKDNAVGSDQFPPWKESDFCAFKKIHEDEKGKLTLEFQHVINRGHPELDGAIMDWEGGLTWPDPVIVAQLDLKSRIYTIICLNGEPDESVKAARALERRLDLGPEDQPPETLEHN